MGQVLEPNRPGRKNHGMILASLPPGGWHTGWVRDAVYAIVALVVALALFLTTVTVLQWIAVVLVVASTLVLMWTLWTGGREAERE